MLAVHKLKYPLGTAYSKFPLSLPSVLPDEIVKVGLPKLTSHVPLSAVSLTFTAGK